MACTMRASPSPGLSRTAGLSGHTSDRILALRSPLASSAARLCAPHRENGARDCFFRADRQARAWCSLSNGAKPAAPQTAIAPPAVRQNGTSGAAEVKPPDPVLTSEDTETTGHANRHAIILSEWQCVLFVRSVLESSHYSITTLLHLGCCAGKGSMHTRSLHSCTQR